MSRPGRTRRSVPAAVLGAAALAAFSLRAVPAGAAFPVCGQVITADTTLAADLTGCGANGLVIGADHVTLDLGGFTISGTPSPLDGAGVLVDGRTGVTVRNGTVTGFDAGVVVRGGSRNVVRAMVARGNVGRINSGSDSRYGDGILLLDSSDNLVAGNVAEANGPLSGIGLRGDSDRNRVQGNLSIRNTAPLSGPNIDGSLQENTGFRLSRINDRAPGFNLLQANSATGNGQDGFGVGDGANDNRLVGNSSVANGFQGRIETGPGSGIRIYDRVFRTLVTGNAVSGNALHGIYIAPTIAFPVPALENRILRNSSLRNEQASPIIIGYDLIDGNPLCDSNLWAGNVFETRNFTGADCLR